MQETLSYVYEVVGNGSEFVSAYDSDKVPPDDVHVRDIYKVTSDAATKLRWWVTANQTSDYAKDAVRFALALAHRMEANPEEDWNKAYKEVEKEHGGLSYFQANEVWKALTELWIGRDRIAGMRPKD